MPQRAMRRSAKLQFLGKSLFIPIFFVVTGFLVNPITFVSGTVENFLLVASIVGALLVRKEPDWYRGRHTDALCSPRADALGHDVKQVPPAYARPSRSQERLPRRAGDRGSAAAIAKAESRRPETALCWSFEVRRATVDCSFRGKWRRVLRRRRGSPGEAPSGIPMVLRELRDGNAKPFAFSCNTSFGACVKATGKVDYVEALAHGPHWSRFRSQRCTT